MLRLTHEQGLPCAGASAFALAETGFLRPCGICENVPRLHAEDFQMLNVTPNGETMGLEEEFTELQNLFAQKDPITQPRKASKNGFMEILLAKRKNMKIKIYQEKGHKLPHIHIGYGKKNHAASYSIESGDRLEGDLPKKYDSDVVFWLRESLNNTF